MPREIIFDPLDAVPMKETEYDFPQELLDAAKVARAERRADQPKYNDDLAKVVARADISEAEARKASDKAERQLSRQEYDTLQRGKVNAVGQANNFGKAFAAVTQEGVPNENAGYVGIADGGITKRMLATDAMPDSVVTVPDAANPGQNALDSDIFEVQEVNGNTGVTLKQGAITGEYVGEKAITSDKIVENLGLTKIAKLDRYRGVEFVPVSSFENADESAEIAFSSRENAIAIGVRVKRPLVASGVNGEVSGIGIANWISLLDKGIKREKISDDVLPYTPSVNSFQYSTPAANVGAITERFNLVDFGILSIIIAQALVTFTAAGTAFMTISKDKVFPASGYKGVVDAAPSTFQPFLIAESPVNPTLVTSGLTHDESNGYRMQMQASAAGTYTMTYVLGTIDSDRLITPWSWSTSSNENPLPEQE